MTDDAAKYYCEIVEPTVDEFLEDETSVRRAIISAIVVTHMADHFFHARPGERRGCKTEDEFRAHLARDDFSYAILRDVCDAGKHAKLRKGGRFVAGVSDIRLQAGVGRGFRRVAGSTIFVETDEVIVDVRPENLLAGSQEVLRIFGHGELQSIQEMRDHGQFFTMESLLSFACQDWQKRLGPLPDPLQPSKVRRATR